MVFLLVLAVDFVRKAMVLSAWLEQCLPTSQRADVMVDSQAGAANGPREGGADVDSVKLQLPTPERSELAASAATPRCRATGPRKLSNGTLALLLHGNYGIVIQTRAKSALYTM